MAQKEATLLLKIKEVGGEAIDKLKGSFAAIATAATVAFAAISAVVVKSIADYRQQEEATNSLNRAMANQGIFTAKLRDEYLANATALQKLTTYGDEEIIAAQAAVQQKIGSIKVTKELTQAILDFAAANKMDAVTAAELFGKSIGGSTNALSRYKIEVDTSATSQEKMASVIQQVNRDLHGQAAAAAGGLGVLLQLKNSVSDIFELMGERFAPTIIVVAKWLNKWAEEAQTASDVLDGLGQILNWVAKAAVTLAAHMEVTGKEIGVNLAAGVAIAEAAMSGNFDRVAMLVKMRSDELNEIQTTARQDLDSKLAELDAAFAERKKVSDEADEVLLKDSLSRKAEAKQLAEDEGFIAMSAKRDEQFQMELAQIGASEEQKLQSRINYLNKQIEAETNTHQKRKLLEEKASLQKQLMDAKNAEVEKKLDEQKVKDREATLNTISTLQRSNNSQLAAIGKAAAITQIAIETPVAIARALGAFPPPFNFIAAGLVGAAMAEQAGRIAGVPLAEGGIVRARPGGIQATIGEGGQDEAVIPLDKAGGIGGGGNNITIIVNGGLLGDENSAHQFAVAIDRKLLDLRRNNESVAFDGSFS